MVSDPPITWCTNRRICTVGCKPRNPQPLYTPKRATARYTLHIDIITDARHAQPYLQQISTPHMTLGAHRKNAIQRQNPPRNKPFDAAAPDFHPIQAVCRTDTISPSHTLHHRHEQRQETRPFRINRLAETMPISTPLKQTQAQPAEIRNNPKRQPQGTTTGVVHDPTAVADFGLCALCKEKMWFSFLKKKAHFQPKKSSTFSKNTQKNIPKIRGPMMAKTKPNVHAKHDSHQRRPTAASVGDASFRA